LKQNQDAVHSTVANAAVKEDTVLNGVGAVPLLFTRDILSKRNTELIPGAKKQSRKQSKHALLKQKQDAVASMVENAVVREDTVQLGVGAVPLLFTRDGLAKPNTELIPGVNNQFKL